jgi:hypothetical protein
MVNPRLSLEHASRRCFSLATRCENSAKLGKRFERKEVPRQRVAASIPGFARTKAVLNWRSSAGVCGIP